MPDYGKLSNLSSNLKGRTEGSCAYVPHTSLLFDVVSDSASNPDVQSLHIYSSL